MGRENLRCRIRYLSGFWLSPRCCRRSLRSKRGRRGRMRERGRRGWRWRNRVNRNCDWLANLHCFAKGHRSNPAGSTNDGAAGAGSPRGDAASGNAPGLNNSVNNPGAAGNAANLNPSPGTNSSGTANSTGGAGNNGGAGTTGRAGNRAGGTANGRIDGTVTPGPSVPGDVRDPRRGCSELQDRQKNQKHLQRMLKHCSITDGGRDDHCRSSKSLIARRRPGFLTSLAARRGVNHARLRWCFSGQSACWLSTASG